MFLTANTETLAEAIQDSADELIALLQDNVDKTVTDLRQKKCITVKEEAQIDVMDTNDQKVSYLLALIRGRSYLVLVRFLDTVEVFGKEDAKSLTQNTYNDYERKRQKNIVDYICAFCNIKEHCRLNDLAVYLWQKHQITSKLYKDIVGPRENNQKESDLWKKIFKECRSMTQIIHIQDYLEEDGLYTHLAEELQEQAKIQSYKIQCGCSNAALKKRFMNLQASRLTLDTISTHRSSVVSSRPSVSYTIDTSSNATVHICLSSSAPAEALSTDETCTRQEKSMFRGLCCCLGNSD